MARKIERLSQAGTEQRMRNRMVGLFAGNGGLCVPISYMGVASRMLRFRLDGGARLPIFVVRG